MDEAFTLYGDSAHNIVSDYIRQDYSDTCAIKSQQLILEKFGVFLSEEQLRNEAILNGWYTPGGGTPMEDVGKLLELHGVKVHQYVNGNVFNLVNELAQGHSVIMGVDSGELWHYGFSEMYEDKYPGGEMADHALIVSGIDTSNPNDIRVIITDPGTGDYCKEYSFSHFIDAANDSNFFMVTTDFPEPNIFDSFGVDTYHLPYIGNMPYQEFHDNYAFLHNVGEIDLASLKKGIGVEPLFDDILDEILYEEIDEGCFDDIDLAEVTNYVNEFEDIYDDINV